MRYVSNEKEIGVINKKKTNMLSKFFILLKRYRVMSKEMFSFLNVTIRVFGSKFNLSAIVPVLRNIFCNNLSITQRQ